MGTVSTVGTLAQWDARAVRSALPWPAAVAALREALLGGLDPEAEPARTATAFGPGELLVMPSSGSRYAGVKLATVATVAPPGTPRIQGVYVLFDAATLAPVALLDGPALTALRTPAVSALGVDLLAPARSHRLVVFGSGPQAHAHVHAITAVRPIDSVVLVGRDPGRVAELADRLAAEGVTARPGRADQVAEADIVVCATSSADPVFPGRLLSAEAFVVACGSHRPEARELDADAFRDRGAVVESVAAAGREAGDVILAGLAPDELVPLADLVTGVTTARPVVFKTVGMSWQDLVVAAAVIATGGPPVQKSNDRNDVAALDHGAPRRVTPQHRRIVEGVTVHDQ